MPYAGAVRMRARRLGPEPKLLTVDCGLSTLTTEVLRFSTARTLDG